MSIETVEIPETVLPDGRRFIAAQDVADNSWLAEFVGRFSNYYEFDGKLNGWVSPHAPMTGFLSPLTPDQREAALAGFDGDDTLGEVK